MTEAQTDNDHKPKQARALKTEQDLLDALVRLLAQKSFADLTVSELAREAGLTTGAIYRRFANKEDVLKTAFNRLLLQRAKQDDGSYPKSLSDQQLLKKYLSNMLDHTLRNLQLLRAVNQLDDDESFDQLAAARAEDAKWLAGRIVGSDLSAEELAKRIRFILRVATATFRDGILSGRGVANIEAKDPKELSEKLDRLCNTVVQMAQPYLGLPSSIDD